VPVLERIKVFVPAVTALAGRYFSVASVFLVLVILAKRLPTHDYGVFVIAFGVAATSSYFSGLGAPDGAVRLIAEARTLNNSELASAATNGLLKAALATLLVAVSAAGMSMTVHDLPSFIPYVCLWIGCWTFLFAMAMGLLALGKERTGSLFFYAAGSSSMMLTVVPYALLAPTPNSAGAIAAAAIGNGCVGLAALSMYFRARTEFELPCSRRFLVGELCKIGLPFAATRIVTLAFSWSIAWAVAFHHGPATGGVVGTIMQIATGVGAPLAAFRFVIRPRLIQLWTLQDRAALQRLSIQVSVIAVVFVVLMLIIVGLVGQFALGLFFTQEFRAAYPLLLLALIGLLAEGATGIADEIVRIGDRAKSVLLLQTALMVGMLPVIFLLARHSASGAVAAYVCYSLIFAGIMLQWATRLLGLGFEGIMSAKHEA
jgi:O-antigen/teichoic acid export membrane protein